MGRPQRRRPALAQIVEIGLPRLDSVVELGVARVAPRDENIERAVPLFVQKGLKDWSNISLVTDGYVYADGRRVVIAYIAFGSPPATVERALTEILDNVG